VVVPAVDELGEDALGLLDDEQLAIALTARLAARMRAVRCFTPRTLSSTPSTCRLQRALVCSVSEKPTR
jgi:hypothetical protein